MNNISTDLLLEIIKYLPVKDIISCISSSSILYNLCNTKTFWTEIAIRDGCPVYNTDDLTPFQIYVQAQKNYTNMFITYMIKLIENYSSSKISYNEFDQNLNSFLINKNPLIIKPASDSSLDLCLTFAIYYENIKAINMFSKIVDFTQSFKKHTGNIAVLAASSQSIPLLKYAVEYYILKNKLSNLSDKFSGLTLIDIVVRDCIRFYKKSREELYLNLDFLIYLKLLFHNMKVDITNPIISKNLDIIKKKSNSPGKDYFLNNFI